MVEETETRTRKTHSSADKVANGAHKAAGQVAAAAEEVEVTIQEAQASAQAANAWFVESIKRLLTAGLGAFALTYDEAEKFVGRLVERGQLAQKDGEKLLSEVRTRFQARMPELPQAEKMGDRVEHGVEEFLNRLNIPSKRDIDELSAKIAQLSARVEELRKSK
jgi:poly(hydroxyalkanoate) granule-associated protein